MVCDQWKFGDEIISDIDSISCYDEILTTWHDFAQERWIGLLPPFDFSFVTDHSGDDRYDGRLMKNTRYT